MTPEAGETPREWPLVAAARSIPRPVGYAGILFGLLSLAGYASHIEVLYRSIPGGPATNPLTALSALCLGVGIALGVDRLSRWAIWLKRIIVLTVVVITVLQLAQHLSGIDLTAWVTPFHRQVLLERHMGMNNSMGPNTAIMLMTIAIALGFHCNGFPKASQIVAAIATAIPCISFLGYLYGHEHFYGQMSLMSSTAGFCLAVGALAMTADRWMLAAVLSPYIGGQVARVQILATLLVPTSVGYLLVKLVQHESIVSQGLLSLLVVAICVFVFVMIASSALFQERTDSARRQSEAQLNVLAQSDALTGLPNRRRFFELGRLEGERLKRDNNERWVLMIDIDYFKNINDTAGHGVGDSVLVAVAEMLSQSIRRTDVIGRLGGEEFAVLLIATDAAGCAQVAESIRENIESLSVSGWTDKHGHITASIGCAGLQRNDTLEGSLRKADEALYQAKKSGRNQVCFSSELENGLRAV